jgi:hypothetical protein
VIDVHVVDLVIDVHVVDAAGLEIDTSYLAPMNISTKFY